MSEHLHPGPHPELDSLSAFAEGVLPEHERSQCLAHLAQCSRCREIVFLAQEPLPVPVPKPAPAWRRWFAPAPVLAMAAAACIAVVGLSWYLHRPADVPSRDLVAQVNPAPPAPPRPVTKQSPPPTPPRPDRAVQPPATLRPSTDSTVPATTPPSLPAPLLPSASASPAPLSVAMDGLSGISGAVTDASGAAVPEATVTLRQPTGTFSRDARTDSAGKFQLTGVPPGRYELQIAAQGFRRTVKEVELSPQQMASVSSVLDVGAVTESVEVSAGASVVESSSAEVSVLRPRRKAVSLALPRPLPSKLPTTTTVTIGKVMLAVDSNGALFISRNAGKDWKSVKPAWSGKVVHLITLPEPSKTSPAVFQLTTDSDADWLSRDGNRWYPAPPRR
jgi:hypothetical protein